MHLSKIKRIIVLTALTVASSINVAAQDLLATQTPVDKKVKTAESVIIQEIFEDQKGYSAEDATTGGGLYQDFTSTGVNSVKATIPDDIVIDLRGFCMPTPSRAVTSNFGPRWGRMHKGLDIKVYIGDTLRSAWPGVVRIVKYDANGYGHYVVIRHPNGLETVYGHMSKTLCKVNQQVRAGEVIGLGGSTGRSYGSHLHFETRLCGVALNPALFFDFRNQDVTGDTYHYRKSTYERESAEATRLRGVVGKGSYTPAMVRGESAAQQKEVAKVEVPRTSDQAAAVSEEIEENVALVETAMPEHEKVYVKVKEGETLTDIANRRKITLDQLYRLNPNLNKKSIIHPGETVRVS